MEVKPGYKQTDAGLIPKDWDALQLGDGIALLSGHHVLAQHCNTRGEGIPYLTGPADFPNGTIAHTKFTEKQTTLCKPDDILVTVKGSGSGTLVVADGVYCISRQLMAIRVRDWEKRFVYYSLLQNASKIKAASTGLIPGLSRSDILEQVLPFPQAAEQRAIAGALVDVDALLGALEKLIAKKRDLKQAAMQQLLTGQTRLPGFSGEWEVKRLGEIGVFRGGNGFPTRYQGKIEGDYPFFKVSDMNNEGNATFMVNSKNWISEVVRKEIGANTFPRHSVVFAKIGAAIFLERKKILWGDSCIDNNMMGFMFNENEAHHAFIHYLFLTIQLGKLVSTTALPSLNGNELAELQFPIPPPEEQTAIAGVLSDMDAEIEALEQRLAKNRALKQGMMQELLTGRVRLI